MKSKKLVLILSVFIAMFAMSCDDDDDVTIYGNWKEAGEFTGIGRTEAINFTIGETFYYGLGYNGGKEKNETPSERYLGDFYSFNGDRWIELATFPGAKRKGAFSFAVGNKGYVGGGYFDDNDTADVYYDDVYEYDPSTNVWTKLDSPFVGGVLAEASTFIINDEAYVVGGRIDKEEFLQKCWKFDGVGVFEELKTAQLSKRRSAAFTFVIDNKAYIGGGYSGNGYVANFEMFDPETGVFEEKRDLYLNSASTDLIDYYDGAIDLRRTFSSAFVIDGKGYIAGGSTSSYLGDCWEYDPITDLWTEKNSFEWNMSSRRGAAVFTMLDSDHIDLGYIIGGYNGQSYLYDVWSLDPNAELDELD